MPANSAKPQGDPFVYYTATATAHPYADTDERLTSLATADVEHPSDGGPFLLAGTGDWMSVERIKADPTTALTDKADRHTSSEALEAALYVAYYVGERHEDEGAHARQYYLSEELDRRNERLPGAAPSIPDFDMDRDARTAWHNSVRERFPYVADYADVVSAQPTRWDDYVSAATREKVSARHEADARSPRDNSHEL